MTKKVNPWIKGTLPRGRHLVYQVLCIVAAILGVVASEEIHPLFGLPVAMITGLCSLVLMVKCLHDAGRSGWWVLIPWACNHIDLHLSGKDYWHKADETLFWLAAIVWLGALITISTIPTKKYDNPYKQAPQYVDETVIDAEYDIEEEDDKGWTPLHYAARHGQTKTAFSLAKAGADLFAHTDDGQTPLDIAIYEHGKDSDIAYFLQGAMKKKGGERQKADELLRELE